jgi:Icc-related predicted phosphoesterase
MVSNKDNMRISFISDTHGKHREIDLDKNLPGGDLLIHAGDFMNTGKYEYELTDFLDWFNSLDNYRYKVFIAGNHDVIFENNPDMVKEILSNYNRVYYLQDNWVGIVHNNAKVKVYGSPWQPTFFNWAFNLDRGGDKLRKVWSKIPEDTDILITHTPPQGILDTSGSPYFEPNLGCELLKERVDKYPPRLHVFGHIHGSCGYRCTDNTCFFNASLLSEQYEYTNTPMHIDWNPKSKTNFKL